MELHSIDTLSEGREDDPRVMVVFVSVNGSCVPRDVIDFATAHLEAWGEEVVSPRLYSIQPDDQHEDGSFIIGVSCEV